MLSALWAPLRSFKRRRGGGWRQRMGDESEDEPQHSISRLGGNTLLRWGEGQISAATTVATCQDAIADGLKHPMVTRVGQLQGSQHAHSELMHMLRTNTQIIDMIRPIHDPASIAKYYLPPSRLIAALHRHHKEQFHERLGAKPDELRTFWQGFQRQPHNRAFVERHPFLAGMGLDDLSYVVPLAVHEDAGPVSKSQSATIISWSSIVGKGSEKLTHFPIASWVKGKHETQLSDHPCWQVLLHDFEKLARGHDHERAESIVADAGGGRPWRFVLLFAKADEQNRCDQWGLVHYNAVGQCCPDCLADRGALPWTDLQATAAWRPTEAMTDAQYLARMRMPHHPLVTSRFAWRYFFLDYMHVLDCKGLASVIYGGLLDSLIRRPSLGSSQYSRMVAINHWMKIWYEDRPGTIRLPPLRLKNLHKDGWADLHGVAIKAAMTRQAAPLFAEMARHWCTADTREDHLMCEVTSRLEEFYVALKEAGMHFSRQQHRNIVTICQGLADALQELRGICRGAEEFRFQIKPKAHKFCHFPMWAACLNPRFISCYADESHVGTCCTIWSRSMSGRYQSGVQCNVLTKRLLSVLLRFEL